MRAIKKVRGFDCMRLFLDVFQVNAWWLPIPKIEDLQVGRQITLLGAYCEAGASFRSNSAVSLRYQIPAADPMTAIRTIRAISMPRQDFIRESVPGSGACDKQSRIGTVSAVGLG